MLLVTAVTRSAVATVCAAFILTVSLSTTQAQTIGGTTFSNDVPGVWIDADGVVKSRQVDEKQDLTKLKAKYKAKRLTGADPNGATGNDLCFVSLPKLIDQVMALQAARKPVPDELRVLGGLTKIQYVFLYPQEHDLVIAGPAEPWARVNEVEVRGIKSGRAVMQLDDLIVAMRDAYRGQQVFGCRIDPDPVSQEKAAEVMSKYATASRKDRMDAMRAALPPQKVSVFGTGADTRVAFVMVAADYKMKRLAMGMDKPPVPGLGNAVDNSRRAMDRFWFEPSYKPMLVSSDGSAFEFRGDRLMLGAGGFAFADKPQTEKATKWAQTFTQKLPAMAELVPVFADLQNVADCAILAALMHRDGIEKKIGWDLSRALSDEGYRVEKVPTAKTADTVVGFVSGSLVAGGVQMSPNTFVVPEMRQADEHNELNAPQEQRRALHQQESPEARLPMLATPGEAEPMSVKP